MAQITITHFTERTPDERMVFSAYTEQAVGLVLYGKGRGELEPSDVTIRTPVLYADSSKSGHDSEVHVEVASGELPHDNEGNKLLTVSEESRFAKLATKVGEELLKLGPEENIAVWVTGYPVSGWYVSDKQ